MHEQRWVGSLTSSRMEAFLGGQVPHKLAVNFAQNVLIFLLMLLVTVQRRHHHGWLPVLKRILYMLQQASGSNGRSVCR
jgi:hypothetical protein